MRNYNTSHIYNIYCNDTSIKNHYVGSSNSLSYRKIQHKHNCNNENSRKYNIPLYQFIRSNGGWDNFSFEVLEEYPCENKEELLKREEHWIQQYNFDYLLNCYRANIPIEELKEYKKQWSRQYYINNAVEKKEYSKNYRINNSIPIKERSKKYRINNAVELKEKNKQYRINNKEKSIKKYNCECGGKYTHRHKSTHFKSTIHKLYIENNI